MRNDSTQIIMQLIRRKREREGKREGERKSEGRGETGEGREGELRKEHRERKRW